MMAVYYCNHCKHEVERDSNKRWLTSFCMKVGKDTRLWRKAAG